MTANISADDQLFWAQFERCDIDPATFHHREHIHLAYVLLAQFSVVEANLRLKTAILNFLTHVGADHTKYQATLTYGWLLLVHRAMQQGSFANAHAFIAANPNLLDKTLIEQYYSRELLASSIAKSQIVTADLHPI